MARHADKNQLTFGWSTSGSQRAVVRSLPPAGTSAPLAEASLTENDDSERRQRAACADPLPYVWPLPDAIERRHFGEDEDGPVEPSAEEVQAITEDVADRLIQHLNELEGVVARLRDAQRDACRNLIFQEKERAVCAYQSTVALYEEDFGLDATRLLESWARREKERIDEGAENPDDRLAPLPDKGRDTGTPWPQRNLEFRASNAPAWDFTNIFPSPLPQAIEAGLLADDCITAEGNRALHDEHARECLAILSDLDALAEGTRSGIDPRTGNKPRTAKAREMLQRYLEAAPVQLRCSLDDMFAAYADAFGESAAAGFRDCLVERHRNRPQVMNGPATEMAPLIGRESVPAEAPSPQYDPGHPWHYLKRGDGATPIPLDRFPPPEIQAHADITLPKNATRRRAALAELLDQQTRHLEQAKARYQELLDRGVECLSEYEKDVCHDGDTELAWASAVAIRFNQICFSTSRIAQLQSLSSPVN